MYKQQKFGESGRPGRQFIVFPFRLLTSAKIPIFFSAEKFLRKQIMPRAIYV
jgi:hypothetical protein